jgi:hypothetical protein
MALLEDLHQPEFNVISLTWSNRKKEMLGDHVGSLDIFSMLIEFSLKTLTQGNATVTSEWIPCCVAV